MNCTSQMIGWKTCDSDEATDDDGVGLMAWLTPLSEATTERRPPTIHLSPPRPQFLPAATLESPKKFFGENSTHSLSYLEFLLNNFYKCKCRWWQYSKKHLRGGGKKFKKCPIIFFTFLLPDIFSDFFFVFLNLFYLFSGPKLFQPKAYPAYPSSLKLCELI